jgi:hypothetical protein
MLENILPRFNTRSIASHRLYDLLCVLIDRFQYVVFFGQFKACHQSLFAGSLLGSSSDIFANTTSDSLFIGGDALLTSLPAFFAPVYFVFHWFSVR